MDSQRHTSADLDVIDLDKALLLMSPEAAQEIRDFRISVKNLRPRQRIEHCQQKRDDLLCRSQGLESAFVCYGLVFQTCSIRKQGEAWDKFDEIVIRSQEASRCLKSLVGVSEVWGKEVIIHYGFVSRYRTYCNELHAIARKVPTWNEAVAILNQSIDQRIRKSFNDGRTRLKESANPIERGDLAYVKTYIKTAKHRRPTFPDLLPGYGRDKYGLIVKAKFAEEPRASSPLPSSSSQQPLGRKPTLGSEDYDRSTLVPSPLLLSSQPCSPSPSSPPSETSPSRRFLTSAWLSVVPLSLLEEGKCVDDRIVNAYMHVLTAKHPGTCFLNSHFLDQYGSEMKKWRPESGKHPLQSDFVMMPVNKKHHWYLLVMYKRSLTGTDTDEWVVCFLDSLGSSHEETFECWKNYLEACGNELMVRKIDVKVPRQTNWTDCGVYVLGFAEEFFKEPSGFTEAVDSGKHLDWKINAPALRKDIRAMLTHVSDAATDNDKATEDDAEITKSLGVDVVKSDGEDRWDCGNGDGESGDDVDPKAESLPASSICTSSSPCVLEGVSDVARPEVKDIKFAESAEMPFSSPKGVPSQTSLNFDLEVRASAGHGSKPEERGSTIDDRLFAVFTTLLDKEKVDLQALYAAVYRVLERVYRNHLTQVAAEQVDLPPRSAGSVADQTLDKVPGTITGQTRKRKRRHDAKDKYSSHGINRGRFSSTQNSSAWGRPSPFSGYLSTTDVQSPLYISQVKTSMPQIDAGGTAAAAWHDMIPADFCQTWTSEASTSVSTVDSVSILASTNQLLPPTWDQFWQLCYNPANTGPQLQLATQVKVSDTAKSIIFATRGNIDGLKYLFGQGLASPKDVSDTRGFSLMRWALYGGMHQYETVQFLLNQGAYIDKESYDHVWDFRLRGKCNPTECQALRCITDSHDRDWIEEQNFPPIHRIILGIVDKPLADELMENPNAVYDTDVRGRTALDWATARAQLQDMEVLIFHGSNLNTMDIDGRTTILHAVDSHAEEALRIILVAGADPNPEMPKGLFRSSPLTSASFGGLAGMMKLLLTSGAKIDACNPEGRTALHSVASRQNAECADILLEHGADLNHVSSSGHTPLTTAVLYNNHTILKLFIDRYYGGSQNGPELLPIIAEHADVETMSILASSLVLKYSVNPNGVATGWQTLQLRKDYDERLHHAFEEFCPIKANPMAYSGPLSILG